ncbi:MAG: hypothetical protein RhofKO_22620 [Rhodothermales bacterium]
MPLVLDAPAPVAERPPYTVPQAPFAAAIRGEVDIDRCSRCLYDATIPNISFDDDGVCNYCRMLERFWTPKTHTTPSKGRVGWRPSSIRSKPKGAGRNTM